MMERKVIMKLWGGRFTKDTNKLVEQYTESISFDKRLYSYDIEGSIAHITMLAKKKIVTQSEKNRIVESLKKIKTSIDDGEFEFDKNFEDIHMNIEKRLIDLTGAEIGGKLHTARSRNDQVITDVKLLVREEYKNLFSSLKKLLESLILKAIEYKDTIMPGFTHLQHAQPVYLSHYLLAYYQKFKRDLIKLKMFYELSDECPLGAGALAGTTHSIDRFMTARLLKFSTPTENSIDTVSDRDFLMDYLYTAALIMLHLSQMSEEFIIWSSQEFNYIFIDDAFTTGSSIMPNKKNPDVCELTRGKTAKVIANINALMILVKALPLSYNRDLQEDKRILFDTIDTVKIAVDIYAQMLKSIKFNKVKLAESLKKGYIEATDVADYLVRKGEAFRSAHKISGELVKYSISKNKSLQDLSIEEYKKYSDKFDNSIFQAINFKNIVNSRKSFGAASKQSIDSQLKNSKVFVKNYKIN